LAVVRVTFVSDIHGNVDALAAVAAQAELLVVLGDLLDYVDYHDPGNGILGQVFGVDRVLEFTALRSAHDFGALRTLNETLWAGVADPLGTLTEVVSRRYRQIADVLAGPTLLTLGNVDVLDIWRQVAGDRLPCLDGDVVEHGGYRFGFVGGGSARPGRLVRPSEHVWQPFVRSADDFVARVGALGPVDVLCTHIPPDIDVLRYDRVPARLEMYGPGVVEYIDEQRPSYAMFGHVHQPLAARTRRGHTECINVGHFQRTGRPYMLELVGR
jgi:Icc-related predicted phosphoesterase